MSKPERRLLRVKDVSYMLSVSEWEVRRLCGAGELRRRYICEGKRYYRITAESVDAYLESLGGESE